MKTILEIATNPYLAFWANVASIMGLLGILLNTWRLSKVKKLIEDDRFRIAETIKPFDLYFNLQKATDILRQQQNNSLLHHEDRKRAADLLTSIGEVAVCLRQYFRDVHKIRNIRDNSYVDAGHLFLVKNDLEAAEEYYERALVEADAYKNKKDISECLQGLKMCSALLGDQEFYDDLDGIADKLGVRIRPRNIRFFSDIQSFALKIAFRSQWFIRKSRFKNGTATDVSRLIVQIRSHLSQYEVTSTEISVKQIEYPDELSSTSGQPEIISRSAERKPRI